MPIIDSKWKVLGDREPWLRYGITTSLSYKGFRLSAMFSGRFNATMVNGTSRAMVADGFDELSIRMREGGDNQFFGVYQDGHENPTYYTQRDAYLGNIPNGYKVGDEVPGSYNPNYSTSSVTPMAGSYYLYWMYNYDEPWVQKHIHYLRCQELRLSYNVPSAWLKKTTRGLVQNALIYVAGNDLFTLTNYQGYDVVGNSLSAAAGGVGGEGIDCWSLPSPRTYSLGLSVTF